MMHAKTDADGVLRIVTTEEYEARKRPGIGAPYPGCEHVDLYPWDAEQRIYYRENDKAEWIELKPLSDGETFPLLPGSSIRLEAPPTIRLEMW